MAQFLLQKAGGGSYLQDGDYLQDTAKVLDGVLFLRPPTFFAGSISLDVQILTGVLFLRPPTFLVGLISLQVQLPATGLRDMGIPARTYTADGSRTYSGSRSYSDD